MRKKSLKRMQWRWATMLTCAGLACALGAPSDGQSADGLLPDLAFQIDCSQTSRADFDDQVLRYLTQQGFRVFDAAKTKGATGDDPGRHELRGIDRRNRIVTVRSYPRRPDHLSFTLLSAPPTRHDLAFDGAVQAFFSRDLICEVSQISTHDNGADGTASFQVEVDRLNAQLQVAEGLDASASKH